MHPILAFKSPPLFMIPKYFVLSKKAHTQAHILPVHMPINYHTNKQISKKQAKKKNPYHIRTSLPGQ